MQVRLIRLEGVKVARLNFKHGEQIVSETIGFASLTNGCSLEEALFTAIPPPQCPPSLARNTSTHAIVLILKHVFILERTTRRPQATPFLPVSLQEEY